MEENAVSVKRAQLQARLAAERANLLYQLRGLDEETLCAVAIEDGWTARDIFPHLGYWDAFYANRMQLVLEGRRREIRSLDGEEALDELNAQTRQQFARLNLSEAIAICLKERHGFLATLARTPDELLYRRIQIRPGWRTSMYSWTRWRHQHDAEHATVIQQWRKRLARPELPRPPASKLLLRPLLQASRQEFMSLAVLLSSSERNTRPVCGPWTLRDVFGHISGYEFMGVMALKQLSEGETPSFTKTIRNFDAFNEAQVTAKQNLSWRQVLEEYRTVRRALVTLLDVLSDGVLMQPFVAPWGSPITGYQYLIGLAVHEQEHAAILRRALHLPLLPKRLRHYRTG